MNSGPDLVDVIKSQANIVDIVSKYVKLKRSSKTLLGLCPFHAEKTPSFHVYPQGHFYCYGCHTHGDVITFAQRYHDISFPEALKMLALELGIDIEQYRNSPTRQHKEIQGLLNDIADYYHRVLISSKRSDQYIKFLIERGLADKKLLSFFQIGWSGEEIPKEIFDKYGQEFLIEAGLIYEYQGRWLPRFYKRIVFPILSAQGQVLGFGGRTLPQNSSKKAPKYLNSPETPLFKKSQILYGVDKVIAQKKHRWVLVVEGYIDVIQLKKYNFPAVAPMGTAFTAEQYKRLLELRKELIFCFDGDQAGQKASLSALLLILPIFKAEHQVSFVMLPDGQDPDSLLVSRGKEYFTDLCKTRKKFVEFLFETIKKDFPSSSPDDQMKFNAKMRSLIRTVECPDSRRGLESSFFQYTRQLGLYSYKKKAPSQNTAQLPKALTSFDMIKLLLLEKISLSSLLSDHDKNFLIFSNDTTVYQLLYGNIDKGQIAAFKSELTSLHLNTLNLIDRQEIEKEFIFQLKSYKKCLFCSLLAAAPFLKERITHPDREVLLKMEDSDIAGVLSMPMQSSSFERLKRRTYLGLDNKVRAMDKEELISLFEKLIENLMKYESVKL